MVTAPAMIRCTLLLLGLLSAGISAAETWIDLDAGINYSDVTPSEPTPVDGNFEEPEAGYHLGIGAYRNNDGSRWVYGVKLELEDVVGNMLLSVRAIDVGYRVTPAFVVNGWLGAARYDLTTPAYGYRAGLGGHYWFSDQWAVTAEAGYGDALARDKALPEENPGVGSPDIFFDIVQISVYLKYRF